MSQTKAGVIITGTEVLTGRIMDRNGPWLSERLRAQGFEVRHITICRDRAEDILAQLDFMHREGIDLVCTTGGLGPTADDMTTALVAQFCNREMFLDKPLLERIRAIVRPYADRFGWDLSALDEGAVKQAHVPREAAVLGPAGTAPGLVVTPAREDDKPVVVVLPGPPGELRAIWAEAIETPEFQRVAAGGTVPEEQMLRMIGVPEPEIARTLREFEATEGLGGLEVTTCLRGGEMEILISHGPGEHDRRAALVAAFERAYGGAIFSTDGETVVQQVIRLLAGRKLAVAESCTGGLLAKRMTDAEGASDFFQGGAVTYSDEAKHELLGVSTDLLDQVGAVSAEVAEQMARGALERFDADFAVSTTGIAGPTGGSKEKPVGTLYAHVAARDGRSNAVHLVLPGRRRDVQERAAMVALHALRALLGA
ncbi:MAG: competence/damage-inducible protein A [Thermoleophilia bacterium]|nr:competence/damage-inducible protein A [Thermoleophilia bacterium]